MDKIIRTKLYSEINEETTEEDMIKIVSKNPVRFFDDSRFHENASVIQATFESLSQKEEFFEEFKNRLNNFKCSKQFIYEAILCDPHVIGMLPQTESICMLALFKDHTCYDKIREPTWEMQKFVLDKINIEKELNRIVLLTF